MVHAALDSPHKPPRLLTLQGPARHQLQDRPELYCHTAPAHLDSLQQAGLEHVQSARVEKQLALPRDEAIDLLAMTPYCWHAPVDIAERLSKEAYFTISLEILLTAYQTR